MKFIFFKMACIVLLIVFFSTSCFAQEKSSRSNFVSRTSKRSTIESNAGISQLIETRNGQTSCWGVIIQLRDMEFIETIDKDLLDISDGKYNRDIKDLMLWSVNKKDKRLTIKFKPGMGDFGTGNYVIIKIKGSAFTSSTIQTYSFTIPTDPL